MDLGSLELQIFVSLTVVLGSAFVALVCDYLKGNNEQLREHNIELRVRKEEQERRLLLDPAGFLGQWLPGNNTANLNTAPAASHSNGRTVSAHEVMQSFAAPEALKEAESRAARFQSRGGDESYDFADVPPLMQRRSGRIRAARKGTRDGRTNGESYGDWVRPEVIARVARRSESAAAYSSDIRDELESTREEVRPEPLNAAAHWDIREQIAARDKQSRPVPGAAPANTVPAAPALVESTVVPPVPVEPEKETVAAEGRMNADEASRLQREIERVSQLDRQPIAPAPGTILRPLTVPSLSLREEIQRVAEAPSVSVALPASWHSPLLDEVIAASGTRGRLTAKTAVVESADEGIDTPQPVAVVEPEIVTVFDAVETLEMLPVVSGAIEAEAPVVAEGIEFRTEPDESVEPISFAFATGEESTPTFGDATVISAEKSSPIVSESPVVAEEPVFQSEAVEPLPFVFVTDEVFELPSTAELADQELEPQPFTFVMNVEPGITQLAAQPTAAFADPLETLMEPGTTGDAPVETELHHFWLESPIAVNENEVGAHVPMANFDEYALGPRLSRLSGMGVAPVVDYLPTLPAIEKPTSPLSLSEEPALRFNAPTIEADSASLPDLLNQYSDLDWEPALAAEELLAVETAVSEPPPFWCDATPVSAEPMGVTALTPPIDISVARQPEAAPAESPAGIVPDLLLPTGVHDASTWTRLLSLPNPMTGILFVITLQPGDAVPSPERKGATPPTGNGPAIERLMASFVRDGDFGTRIAENEWIFIYNHDVAGFNRRRVGMISEKLWDFQLRHLGMANVRFKWGAVDVKSERLAEAVQAARDRMNQTQRARKLPGADQSSSRRVVNA